MRLAEARAIATAAMREHGLIDNEIGGQDWGFEFDSSKRRFGACHWATRKITLSRKLVLLNDMATVKDTILHEIAHALAGARNGHNYKWRNIATTIGCDGSRTYDSMAVKTPPAKYLGKCPNCPFTIRRHRRSNGSCPRCSGGRYNPAYRLVWVS